jgi:hypothetical protein
MEEISKKFDKHLSAFSANNMDPPLMALSNKMREQAIEWQKGSSILKCTAGFFVTGRSISGRTRHGIRFTYAIKAN